MVTGMMRYLLVAGPHAHLTEIPRECPEKSLPIRPYATNGQSPVWRRLIACATRSWPVLPFEPQEEPEHPDAQQQAGRDLHRPHACGQPADPRKNKSEQGDQQ